MIFLFVNILSVIATYFIMFGGVVAAYQRYSYPMLMFFVFATVAGYLWFFNTSEINVFKTISICVMLLLSFLISNPNNLKSHITKHDDHCRERFFSELIPKDFNLYGKNVLFLGRNITHPELNFDSPSLMLLYMDQCPKYVKYISNDSKIDDDIIKAFDYLIWLQEDLFNESCNKPATQNYIDKLINDNEILKRSCMFEITKSVNNDISLNLISLSKELPTNILTSNNKWYIDDSHILTNAYNNDFFLSPKQKLSSKVFLSKDYCYVVRIKCDIKFRSFSDSIGLINGQPIFLNTENDAYAFFPLTTSNDLMITMFNPTNEKMHILDISLLKIGYIKNNFLWFPNENAKY